LSISVNTFAFGSSSRMSLDIEDDISWNLTENDHYSSKSAYIAQFFGATLYPIVSSVWKLWAPPKIKLVMWLALQNCLCINDRL
jgi:hypothetical protein